MTNEQQQSPIFRLDKLKKHLYNTIWGIKPLLMLRLVVSIQTNHTFTSLDSINRLIFSYKVFSSLSPCWFFIRGGKCSTLIVLHTVQGYFWRTRQGQTWYVWGGQTIEAGFPKRQGKDSPRHCLNTGLRVLMQDWAFLRRCSVLDRPNT